MKRNCFVNISFLLLFTFTSLNAKKQDEMKIEKGQLIPATKIVRSDKLRNQVFRTMIFEDDFESGSSGWDMDGEWAVGFPTSGSYSGHNSNNCAATDLHGEYSNNADHWLISPEITLGSATEIKLYFWEWFEIESGYDSGIVKISTDGGSNWIDLSLRDGYSDWRETEIDITLYQNESIKIAYNFTSDGSVTYSGWYVDDIRIETQEPQALTATMMSLNSQNFPFIYMNVAVDSMGIGTPYLSQSNFEVYENSTLQTDYFEVTPPETGGGSRLADIVICMDNSGSMDEEQNAIENNMIDFVDNLVNSGVDYALGLCRFGQDANNGYPIIEDNGILTSDADYFKYNVWQRNVIDGGFEPGWDALFESATDFTFRPGSQKIFILITDENVTGDDNYGNYSQNDALNVLFNNSITTFALIELNSTSIQDYGTIAEDTNGAYFDIYTNFDDILTYISSQVSNTYLIRYKSNDPTYNGVTRNVEVEVSYFGEQDIATGSYIPGAAPQIERTPDTIDLHNQAWAEYTEFTIEVEITDDITPFVQSATLYYKNTSESNYNSVSMYQTSRSEIWEGIIPSGDVETPGVDYYITASDGQSTSSDPTVEPSLNPYQIAILPNVAPEITHTPVVTLTPNVAVDIEAEVVDNTNTLDSAQLFYRKTGQLTYQVVDMYNTYSNNYEADIPSNYSTADGADYFLKASDNFGVHSFHGTPDNPHQVYVPGTTFIIKDTNDNPITNTEFSFYRIDNIDPTLQYPKQSLETDSDGKIEVPGNWFNPGELVKISKLVHTEDVVKPNHEEVDDVMYYIEIDNAEFDDSGGIEFTEYTGAAQQEVILGHTTVKYNLVISVEWDAEYSYLQNLFESMRYASNYLYDVSDGQITINRIAIYENKQHWNTCDIRVYADNTVGPNAFVSGMEWIVGCIKLPRKWFGDKDDSRNYSYTENPLILTSSDNYRTTIHEIGHYSFKFYDEYRNWIGTEIHPNYNFGFMDYQYNNNEPYASEMSSVNRYPDSSYENTHQFQWRGMSCWDYFESNIEDEYNNIFCPINKPDELGIDYMVGPNNVINNLEIDVGSLLTGIIHENNNGCFETILEVTHNGNQVQNAKVWLHRLGHPWIMKEGATSDNGFLRCLGTKNMDELRVYAFPYFGITYVGAARDLILEIEEVDGNYNSISQTEFRGGDEFRLTIKFEEELDDPPFINILDEDGNIFQEELDEDSDNYYDVTFDSDLLDTEGAFWITVEDDDVGELPIYFNYVKQEIGDEASQIFGNDGNLEIRLNEFDSEDIDQMIITTNDLPTLRNGLNEDAEQAGNCYSVYSYPDISNLDETIVTLRYADSDITEYPESSIRIHRWENSAEEWQIVGGTVDTLRNEVTSQIEDLGVYAAFTTKQTPGTQGSLNNNNIYIYPNPFNPKIEEGTIRYSLSEDGNVTINIYDISGAHVSTLLMNESQVAGSEQSIKWNGRNDQNDTVANGVYFYVIESSSGERAVGKAAVLK